MKTVVARIQDNGNGEEYQRMYNLYENDKSKFVSEMLSKYKVEAYEQENFWSIHEYNDDFYVSIEDGMCESILLIARPCYYPIPLPCELCPFSKQCKVTEDKQADCKMKYNISYLNWKADHPLFGTSFAELNQMQHNA